MTTGRRWLSLLWVLVGLSIVAIVVTRPGWRDLLAQSARTVSPPAVLATLPGQALAFLLCAGALSALRPGVPFGSCLASRVLRDAGGNLLVFTPGLGEMIGARALVLAGGRTRAAITASALDVLAEGVAQLPYGLLAVAVLPQLMHVGNIRTSGEVNAGAMTAIVVVATGTVVVIGWALRRAAGARGRLVARVRSEAARVRADCAGRRLGMAVAIVFHLLAWSVGGFQLWAAARVLGLPLDLFQAIVVESAAYAARAVMFFVPAGLAVQEGALIVACAAFGVGPVPALALALVLRLRDVVCGLPLLLWPLLEYRHLARSRARALPPIRGSAPALDLSAVQAAPRGPPDPGAGRRGSGPPGSTADPFSDRQGSPT